MARSCSLCFKGTCYGNNVSNSNRKTRRTWKVNLVSVRSAESKRRVKVCTRCLRSDKVKKLVRV